jgi:DNA-binding MarR family transcriptional regulator
MDIDPGIDRQHFSLVLHDGSRRRLPSAQWRLFASLYQRHGRIVSLSELATATGNAKSNLDALIQRLQRNLVRSRFLLRTLRTQGCELIVRTDR